MELGNRLIQALLIGAAVAFCWFAMQAVHESGHVLHAWITGGRIARLVLNNPACPPPDRCLGHPVDSLMAECHPPIIFRQPDALGQIAVATLDLHKHRA